MRNKNGCVLGVISDTHGTLTGEAAQALNYVDLIIHAGDIDRPAVLRDLRCIAPVVAVRGNMDRGAWTSDLPETQVVDVNNMSMYILHDINALDIDPAAAGFKAVISGHTHRPSVTQRHGVLYLNPGSAWMPRANHPVSMAIIYVQDNAINAKLVDLTC